MKAPRMNSRQAVASMRALYRPLGRGDIAGTVQAVASMRALYRPDDKRLPTGWRDRLPDPENYYRAHVVKLSKVKGNGWAQGQCPFHEDRNASLSVNLAQPRGFWKCFAGCGSGDIVSFHMKRTGLPFNDAARELLGVRA